MACLCGRKKKVEAEDAEWVETEDEKDLTLRVALGLTFLRSGEWFTSAMYRTPLRLRGTRVVQATFAQLAREEETSAALRALELDASLTGATDDDASGNDESDAEAPAPPPPKEEGDEVVVVETKQRRRKKSILSKLTLTTKPRLSKVSPDGDAVAPSSPPNKVSPRTFFTPWRKQRVEEHVEDPKVHALRHKAALPQTLLTSCDDVDRRFAELAAIRDKARNDRHRDEPLGFCRGLDKTDTLWLKRHRDLRWTRTKLSKPDQVRARLRRDHRRRHPDPLNEKPWLDTSQYVGERLKSHIIHRPDRWAPPEEEAKDEAAPPEEKARDADTHSSTDSHSHVNSSVWPVDGNDPFAENPFNDSPFAHPALEEDDDDEEEEATLMPRPALPEVPEEPALEEHLVAV